jgi:hypothetical protein
MMRYLTTGALWLLLGCTSTEPKIAVALEFNEVPTQAVVGEEFSARIAVVSSSGEIVTSARPIVTLSVSLGPTAQPISDFVTATNGLAHFDMTLGVAGNYTLHATSPGLQEAIVLVNVVAPGSVHGYRERVQLRRE